MKQEKSGTIMAVLRFYGQSGVVIFRFFISLLIALTLFFIDEARCKEGADVIIAERSFDFGAIKEGTPIEHTFTVVNNGSSLLKITAVKPDCGCTSSEFDSEISPGREGHITLKMDTSGYKGRIKKAARVFTNDPDNEMILLYLEAVVKQPILMSKEYVVFKGAPGDVLTESIIIEAQENTPLEIETLDYTLDDNVIFSMEEIERGRAYRLNFSNKPELSGVFSGQLRLKTNYPEQPEILIKIRGRFIG
ncbi:MAG: DUF1573 domain-containing protein [Deltaproteobacteria bacterium]|nr:DUF1573 domain-containing protein [Deltaproteobacteria bacterium]